MILRHLIFERKFVFAGQSNSGVYSLIFLSFFILINTLGRAFIARIPTDIVAAYTLLLFGIFSSSSLENSNKTVLGAIKNLGFCSFGIYLIHPLLLNLVEILLKGSQAGDKVTIFSLMLISAPTFLTSWAIVSMLSRCRALSSFLFST
jgi:peptidoglycan/LPS O-acetylase OafA/YrhL